MSQIPLKFFPHPLEPDKNTLTQGFIHNNNNTKDDKNNTTWHEWTKQTKGKGKKYVPK